MCRVWVGSDFKDPIVMDVIGFGVATMLATK
jgi:hypothetical protein